MQKKGILLVVVILLSAAGLCQAAAGELHGTIDVTYLSKYIWRGFDLYGDKSAIQPALDLDLYGTGFGMGVIGHRANSDKYEKDERWDYSLYYGNKLCEGEPLATNYRISWVYYNYPERSSHSTKNSTDGFDLQEVNGMFSWPNILPVKGLVPSYVLVKMWPTNSGSWVGRKATTTGTASGFAHIFMLDYPLQLQGVLPETPPQVLNLHSEVIYNDGIGPQGQNIDQDWTNAVFGISTNFDLGNKVTLTPGVYHQITMDKSANPDKDETWASMSLKYAF